MIRTSRFMPLALGAALAVSTVAVSAAVAIPLVILDLLISLTVWSIVDHVA